MDGNVHIVCKDVRSLAFTFDGTSDYIKRLLDCLEMLLYPQQTQHLYCFNSLEKFEPIQALILPHDTSLSEFLQLQDTIDEQMENKSSKRSDDHLEDIQVDENACGSNIEESKESLCLRGFYCKHIRLPRLDPVVDGWNLYDVHVEMDRVVSYLIECFAKFLFSFPFFFSSSHYYFVIYLFFSLFLKYFCQT